MSHRVEKTLVVAVPVARAWRAFADSRERSQWEAVEFEIDPRPGGRVRWTLPGMECRGRVVEVEPERLLRHTEGSGPHAETEVAVRFEPVGARTRISVTHSGFGEGDDAALAVESVSLGWTQALADLVVYLERGVPAGRFVRRMLHAGLQVTESAAGLEVRTNHGPQVLITSLPQAKSSLDAPDDTTWVNSHMESLSKLGISSPLA